MLCVARPRFQPRVISCQLPPPGMPRQLGMLDDASDSDCERGDERGPPGALPQDHSDLRRIRVAERRRKLKVLFHQQL